MSRGRILLVDDEPMVLRAMERVLEMSLSDCDIVKAENGRQALELSETQPADIIVSDMCMPDLSGSELLDVIHERYPQTVRMILSARAGSEYGLSAIESAHQYFLKPGDIVSLARKLQRVLDLRARLPNRELDRIVARIGTLPSLPDLYRELEAEIEREDASIYAVGRILEQDVAMSAKILQLVNSAFFGVRSRISSATQAATLLGMNLIKSLALASHVFSVLDKDDPRAPFLRELWRHSADVSGRARRIALTEKAGHDLVEEACIGGLFHDIGKLVIATSLPDTHEDIQRMLSEKAIADVEAEQEILGVTHHEIGGYLLTLWGFSETVVHVALYHGIPSRSEEIPGFGPLGVVHAANVFDHENVSPAESLPPDMAWLETAGLVRKMDDWRSLAVSA